MPNHCYTEMHVEGTKERLDEFLEFMTERDEAGKPISEFSFQKVIPRPKELDIESGSIGSLGYEVFFQEGDRWMHILTYPWVAEHNISTREELQEFFRNKDDKDYEAAGRQYHENIQKYGFTTWYDWNCANWGTKWNAYDVSVVREDDERAFITFLTAWSFPEPIFDALFDKFEDLSFTGIIDEEGGFFYGELKGNSVEFYDGVRPGNEYTEEDEEEEIEEITRQIEASKGITRLPQVEGGRKLIIPKEDE